MDKFDVKFVPFGKDGETFAKDLKTEMNKVVKNGWTIIRSESMNNGYLIIAHKVQVSRRDAKSANIFDLLKEQIARGDVHVMPVALPEMEQRAMLSEESTTLLNTFFAANHERMGNKKAIIAKMDETLPQVLRRYPSTKLRPIFENIKAYADAHEKHHDGGKGCELVEILKAVVEAGNKYVQQSAC